MSHSDGPDPLQMEAAKRIGALPVIKVLAKRLQLAAIVNSVIPRAPQAAYGFGELCVAVVMNKLSTPSPLYKLVDWAANSGVEPLLGVPPDALTDDRVAAMLDAVAENVEKFKTEVFLNAIEHFGLDVTTMHWDLTSVEFEGSYDEQDPLFPFITYGYAPRGSGKKKQYRVADLVIGDGAVGGALHKTYSGNTTDINTVTDYITLFAQIRDRFGKRPKLVGDTKLLSPLRMGELEDAGLFWICPEPHQEALDDQYLQLPKDGWENLPYVSVRERDKPEDRRTVYRAQEVQWELPRPKPQAPPTPPRESRKTKHRPERQAASQEPLPAYTFRRIFVFSSEERDARRASRANEFERAQRHLEEQSAKFAGHYWRSKGEAEARRAVEKILEARKTVGKLYKWDLARDPEGGWTLTYSVNQEALDRLASLDGYYTLVTNVPRSVDDTFTIFRDWKQQSLVERRFADWKGPLRVRPLFLKTNKRVVGLVAVLSVALLIFCLIEREVRQELKDTDGSMVGLLPVKRAVRATGRNIIQALDSLTVVAFRFAGRQMWQLVPPNATQRELLRMLKIDTDRILRGLRGTTPDT